MTDSRRQHDIVVIGGGTAALCAAISARRLGASVLLLEQAPEGLRGGNTRHSRNLRITHDAPTSLTLGVYGEEEFRQDIDKVTEGTADPSLTGILARRSSEVTDWLAAAGVQLQPTAGGLLPPSRKTAFFLGGGKTALNRLYATAEGIGVEIRYACEVRDLRITDRRVETVSVLEQGVLHQSLCPGAVILCCGGSQANRHWLRAQWGAAADGFINRGTPFASGEILASILSQGAMPVGDPKRAYLVAVDARSPADDGGIVTRIRCMPAGIVVDREGRRIYDEGADAASTRYSVWGQRLASYPGQIAYLILDATGVRSAPPSLHPPIDARTIGQLARRLDIEPAALEKTVAAYNSAVRSTDADQDCSGCHTLGLDPPKSRYALPLNEAPYSAYPMRPGITFTYYGVAVDTQTRVRSVQGGGIDNLFAAGMIMAPNIIGRGYISGLAITIGVVFGRVAGEEAARHVLG